MELIPCKDCKNWGTKQNKDGYAYCDLIQMLTHQDWFCASANPNYINIKNICIDGDLFADDGRAYFAR